MGLVGRAGSSLWETPWGHRVLKTRGQAEELEEAGGRKERTEAGSSRWRARHAEALREELHGGLGVPSSEELL